MRILITTLSILLLHFLYACGSTTLLDEPDIILNSNDTSVSDSGTNDISSDVQEDASLPDTGYDTGSPEKCDNKEACNYLLKEDKLCEGSCIFQEHSLSCDGNVFNNLCYQIEPPQEPVQPKVVDGIKITPPLIPMYITEGDRLEITLILTNSEEKKKELSYSYKNPDNWEIFPENFSQSGTLSFDALEAKTLRFNANALRSNMFNTYYSPVITFYFNDVVYEIYIWIKFPGNEGYIRCNDLFYPPSYCLNQNCSGYAYYNTAVCCENIFYPGSSCCSDSDCTKSVCIDGKCVYQVPGIFLANSTLIQNNRILVILSDYDGFEEKDLCKDKSQDPKYNISTKEIEEYYSTIIYNRTKRQNVINFKWEILAGFRAERFITDNRYDFQSYKDGLQKYLNDLGCGINFEDYDKLIIISPRLDLMGFGGMAFGNGYIGQVTYANYYITIHELAHSFGASDLYLDLGGNFQYLKSIMAANLGGFDFPEDKVTWGEIGLGDIDKNGVIDLFEFAKFPEKIVIRNIKANLTYKDSVEISFEPMLLENNKLKKGIFYSYYIELPEYNAAMDLYGTPYIAFDQYSVDLNKIRETKKLKIRIKTQYRYSDAEFRSRLLTFDKTYEIDVGEIKE